MSKRKGVSADEKKARMLQLFYEKQEFFQLKELEKIAPKEKGIIAQSVKDVVQNLVDDGLVDSDKIGTSVYYWAYPSKAHNARKRKLEEASEQLAECQKKLKTYKEKLEIAKEGKEESSDRQEVLEEIIMLEMEDNNFTKQLQEYKDNDPEAIEQAKTEIQGFKDAINRWTDNIYSIKSWAKRKFCIEDTVLNKQFGIPTELDYIS